MSDFQGNVNLDIFDLPSTQVEQNTATYVIASLVFHRHIFYRISDILIKLLILATELAIKFKMYFVSFIKWLFLVWGMHFLSLKQLIADKEKSAIYRQYQFMEEKRCISKSLILLNEVIWL